MDDRPLITCPRCGAEDHFHHATVESKNRGAMLLVGGIWAYLLTKPSDDMYICDRCHYVFEPDPRINKWVALSVVILCGIMLVVVFFYWLLVH